MRDEGILSLPRPFEELRHRLVEVGRIRNRFVRNAGQLGDFRRDRLVRIDVGLERVAQLALDHAHGGDFGDFLARRVEAGGFKVKDNERAVERLGAASAHDRQAVRVVDVVRLDAVNDLHVPDDVLLLALLCVERLWKGLRDAVVGDGHGAVPPLCRAAEKRRRAAHAVHRGHIGVQMQLNALHAVIGVLALGLFRLDDAGRLEHHLAGVGVEHHLALHGAVQTLFNEGGRVPCLVGGEELGNAHGIGAVGDVEGDFHVVLAGFLAVDLLVLGEKDLALNGHHVVGGDGLVDRNDGVLNELAEHEVVLAHLLGFRALICRSLGTGRARLLFRLRLALALVRRLFHSLVQKLGALLFLFLHGHGIRAFERHGVHRAGAAGFPADSRLQMAQRSFEMLFADGVHRDMQRTVRELPVVRMEQTACRGHTCRHIVIERADVLSRKLALHLVARLDAHAVKAVLASQLLFHLRHGVAPHDLVQTQLDHHHRTVIAECERAHLARGKMLLLADTFTVVKNIYQLGCHRLFSFKMCNFVHKLVHEALLRHLAEDFAAAEDESLAVAARNAEVGLSCLAGAVYHAAHDRDLELSAVDFGAAALDLLRDADKVDARASAGRAGNDVDALLGAAHRTQDGLRGVDLLHRVIGQRNADGVAHAEREQTADAGRRLDGAHVLRAGLGHAEVQRIARPLTREQIRLHGVRHGRGLDGDADVIEIAVV